jgi:Domain of unknown function (DUF1848)
MPWFMASLARGAFDIINPYNHTVSTVPATPDRVHTIVFWSKDFGRFLGEGYADELTRLGYRFFFNFTINSADSRLEPQVPPLKTRLTQLTELCRRFGPQTVQWRFDPICHLRHPSGAVSTNLTDFDAIARHAFQQGIQTCITSFADLYRKVLRRLRSLSGIALFDPPLDQKVACVQDLEARLTRRGMRLQLCCEKEVLEALPAGSTVSGAACIPNHQLINLYGPGISLRKDTSQRAAAGCGCRASRDIGSYNLHVCHHNCLFCYANPACDQPAKGEPQS